MEDNEYVKHLSIVGKWSPEMSKKYVQVIRDPLKDFSERKEKEIPKQLIYSNEEEFIKAASEGNLKTLLNLNSKVVVDARNSKGQTALISATIGGHVPAVKFLLAKHAMVKILDETGNSALHHACLKEDISVLKVLLNKTDPNLKNLYGQTILHLIVKGEKYQALELLLHSTGININEQDNDGNTAVHIAITERNIKFLMKLLAFETDLSLYNKDGMNPVNLAIIQDDIECLKLLVNSKHGISILTLKTQYNESNFQMAVRTKSMAIVNYLINWQNQQIVTSEIDDKYGYTCLHWATLQLNKDLIEIILCINEKLVNTKDRNGKTVFDHLVNMYERTRVNQSNIMEIAIKLIQHDADIDQVENRIGFKKMIKDIFTRCDQNNWEEIGKTLF